MRLRSLVRFIACSLAFGLWVPTAATAKPVLTVYTYDSLVAEWGPGPALEKGFEAECACDLRWVTAGDGAELLGRLLLEGAKTPADVVLGLDDSLMPRARAKLALLPHGVAPRPHNLPIAWADTTFLPFDWGWFAFVYRRDKLPNPPTSFADLASDPKLRLIIQDPRSSTPGLGLLNWVRAAKGDQAASTWQALAPRITHVTKGWSEAYNLYLEGTGDMVLSYTTSPAYHQLAEKDHSHAAALFTDGHLPQIEVAAVLASTKQPELARRFMAYLASDAAQALLPETNWMYPAFGPIPPAFQALPKPARSLPQPDEAGRAAAIDIWLNALSR